MAEEEEEEEETGTVARQRNGLLGGEARSVNKGTLVNNVNMSIQDDINVRVRTSSGVSEIGSTKIFSRDFIP